MNKQEISTAAQAMGKRGGKKTAELYKGKHAEWGAKAWVKRKEKLSTSTPLTGSGS